MHNVAVERTPSLELMTDEEMRSVDGGSQVTDRVERLYRAGKLALMGLALGGVLGIGLLGQAMYVLMAE